MRIEMMYRINKETKKIVSLLNISISNSTDNEKKQNIIKRCICKMIRPLKKITEIMRTIDWVDLYCICFQVNSRKNKVINIFRLATVEQYCRETGMKYEIVESKTKRAVYKPEFFEMVESSIELYESPEIYVAEVKNVTIIGATGILLVNDKCLFDSIVMDTEQRYAVHFAAVRKRIKEYVVIETEKEQGKIEKGIFLLGFASYNYYHLTIEILSRLNYIDQMKEYHEWPILVDNIILKIPQYKKLLERVNIYNHPIISIKENEMKMVENLVFPSMNTWMPINLKKPDLIRTSDFLVSKSALDNIRNVILDKIEKKQTRKIFISRKNIKATRLKNEENIKQLFIANGFEVVYTEEMTLEEQVNCFQEAKCIVGTSGAALTNMVYCQPQTIVACIIPEEYKFYMYSSIAYLLQLQPRFLDARVTERTAYNATDVFEVDYDYISRFIETINRDMIE